MYKVQGEASSGTLRQFPVHILFLDETIHRFFIDKKAKGADLLNLVFQVSQLPSHFVDGLINILAVF